jgi:fibronectin-binding autotransporter adhesin
MSIPRALVLLLILLLAPSAAGQTVAQGAPGTRPWLTGGATRTASGTFTTPGNVVTLDATGLSTAIVQFGVGGGFNNFSAHFEGSIDGTNFYTLPGYRLVSGNVLATAPDFSVSLPTRTYVVSIAGYSTFRVVLDTLISGSPTALLVATSTSVDPRALDVASEATLRNVLDWLSGANGDIHVTDTNFNAVTAPAGSDAGGAFAVQGITGMKPLAVTGNFFQATQPVSGTFFQTTQPVSGPLTDTQLRATPVPISGSTTVSGTITANQGTAAAVASAWPAKISDGTSTAAVKAASTAAAATDPALVIRSIQLPAALGQTTMANSSPVTIASDQPAFDISDRNGRLLGAVTAAQGAANSTPWTQDLTRIGGNTVVTAGVNGLLAVGGNIPMGQPATANPVPVGGVFTTTPATLATGQTAALQFTAAQNVKQDLSTIAGTAPTTAGKIDVKGADGDVFVRQATGTNLHAVIDTGSTTAVTQATAANLNATVTQLALTKGTQGSTGVSTQDLKDAGRTSIMLTASAASTAVGETLITLTKSAGLAATTTCSSCTITTGKTFRIQSIAISARNSAGTTPTSNVTVNIRAAVAGATTTASPLQMHYVVNIPATTASTLFPPMLIPDGFEIASNGATNTYGLTITHPQWVTGTTTATFDITIVGFEY